MFLFSMILKHFHLTGVPLRWCHTDEAVVSLNHLETSFSDVDSLNFVKISHASNWEPYPYDLPITDLDALSLSYRRLVGVGH